MNKICRLIAAWVLILFAAQPAFAGLPNLPLQEMWVKIVIFIAGIGIIGIISIAGINRILYSMGIEADLSAKFSIVTGITVCLLWFIYVFGRLADTVLYIALGIIVVIALLAFFLREKQEKDPEEDEDTYKY